MNLVFSFPEFNLILISFSFQKALRFYFEAKDLLFSALETTMKSVGLTATDFTDPKRNRYWIERLTKEYILSVFQDNTATALDFIERKLQPMDQNDPKMRILAGCLQTIGFQFFCFLF